VESTAETKKPCEKNENKREQKQNKKSQKERKNISKKNENKTTLRGTNGSRTTFEV